MTAILSLPEYRATAGIGLKEDWRVPLAFVDPLGLPIDLTGIVFETTLTAQDAETQIYSASTPGADLAIGGADNNELTIRVLAADKQTWPAGVYVWTLLATGDGVARHVFANSSLRVGAARSLQLLRYPPGDSVMVSAFPVIEIARLIALMSISERRVLLNALFSAAPNFAAGDDPADFATGDVYINGSSFATLLE